MTTFFMPTSGKRGRSDLLFGNKQPAMTLSIVTTQKKYTCHHFLVKFMCRKYYRACLVEKKLDLIDLAQYNIFMSTGHSNKETQFHAA